MRFRARACAFFVAAGLAAILNPVAAQQGQPQAVPSAPVDLSQQIPLDPAVRTGRFDNGLRYFVRTARRPEKRAELRLVVDVGSVVEEDDQRGLAHLLEHMAFNGTKHFPKQEIPTFLESLGMRFGPSVNAYTSFDETVYMLQVPTEKPEVLDRAFLILEDWAHGQTLDPVEIDKERGVVREEWRLRRGAAARMQDQQFPIMLKGSRYAERLPIGSLEVIDTFPHERLRKFYADWYRPDLMTVVAVGDFDVAAVEKMIRAHFEHIPAPAARTPRPSYPVPDHPGTLYAIATDNEATSASITIYSKMEPPDPRTLRTYRQAMVERLFSSMLGARFSELSQKPDAPFIGAGGSRGQFVRTKHVSTLSALVKGDAIQQTMDVLFTEAERVARFGFTPGELERAKVNVMTSVDRALREKDNTPAAAFANRLVQHALEGDPVPAIEYEHGLYSAFLPQITLAEVNALAKDWVPDRSRVVTISAPQKDGFAVPTEQQLTAVIASVGKKEITAYVDTVDDAPLLDPAPKPGTITDTVTKEKYGITEWRLSNGVKVVLKPTDFREDEIIFRASSYGGTSLVSDADYIPASSAATVVMAGGLGRFSQVELRKKMTGKVASASPFVTHYEEGLNGSSSKKDLETLFQLIHLRFTQPRGDANAFTVMRGQMQSSMQNQEASPGFHYTQALTAALRQNHPRMRLPTPDTLAQWDLDKSMAFYRDRFGDAGDFTFVFAGSFDLETMRPLVERYLASLPSRGRKETWKDVGIRYATGVVEKRVEKGMEPQGRATLVFTGAFSDQPRERVVMRALADVLTVRLREKLREDLGGTYGVSVSPSYTHVPVGEYAMSIAFACDPSRTDELIAEALKEIELLKTAGPTEAQVADVREKLLRDFETSSKQNAYWATQLSLKYQAGEPPDSLFELPDTYRRLTPGMIHAAARQYLNTANLVKVTLFPERKS
ncbi:MAG TPA: insulinase family protein [Vicinamibacterales bacterium]|nr:insulinase family protein [Vicinamibacterales bacterium]